MITLFRTSQIYALDQIKNVLAAHIRSLPGRILPVGLPLKILRYEFPCEPIDILTWLHNQHVAHKIYWSGRANDFEIGGIGVADIIEGKGSVDHAEVFAHMEDRLAADNPNLRYYGGMNFDGPVTDINWQSFGSYRFVVPRFELLKTNGQTILSFNIAFKDVDKDNVAAIVKELDTIDFSPATTYRRPPKVLRRADFPDRKGWETAFARIKTAGGKFKYDKIVLARKSVFDFDVYIDPSALLKHLKDKTPQCFHFCFQTGKTTAFLGASPERLYKRVGDGIETEAVAGTSARGATSAEDAVFEKELLNSSKNALEHRYVVDAIREALGELCTDVRADAKARLVKLEGGQHLVTQFQGTSRDKIFDDRIITRLHPTPAVAGCPKEEVLRAIKEIEPFDRGWYAGPVGCVGYEQSEFAVAIRCALVNHDKLSLYAGAGIVEGSTPEGEWREIETKIGNFIEVFNTGSRGKEQGSRNKNLDP
ncbi:MAG: isochorismate synthase [Candidatus Omnitrophica bacterium]|nr:isochorismate synthase [Candidatus Omnitrophota bacterium]